MSKSLSTTAIEAATLVDLLRWRAERQSDQLAYIFLHFKEQEYEDRLTYKELDRQARAIAASLQQMGVVGERVLLLYPSSLEYIAAFFGCLYAGVIAIPAYPPHSARTLPRIQAIIDDSQTKLVLTTTQVQSDVKSWFAEIPAMQELAWFTTDTVANEIEHEWREPEITSESLAFLQYTSGSTATPKGVMVTHGNLLHNMAVTCERWAHTEHCVSVSWLPIFHDMGLIAGVLQAFYVGFPAVVMAPAAFIQRPMRWLEAMSKYKATTTYAPNFAFELCIRKSTPAERAQLDLRRWCVAMNGAEPIHSSTLERFAEAFKISGFRPEAATPAYGLAEATLVISTTPQRQLPLVKVVDKAALEQNTIVQVPSGQPNSQIYVGCGPIVRGQKVVIAHPELRTICPPDVVGEIWVSGESVAKGYWNRPEETKHTFGAYLADTDEGPFMRTGDLGFMQDGELFITGRMKDVIIIRGRNHYPQDIERTAEHSHPSLRPGCSAAFSIEADNEERLVVVVEVDPRYKDPVNPQDIIKAVRQAVAEEHDLLVYQIRLLKVGGVEKTSSGKVRRKACRADFLLNKLPLWSSQNS